MFSAKCCVTELLNPHLECISVLYVSYSIFIQISISSRLPRLIESVTQNTAVKLNDPREFSTFTEYLGVILFFLLNENLSIVCGSMSKENWQGLNRLVYKSLPAQTDANRVAMTLAH